MILMISDPGDCAHPQDVGQSDTNRANIERTLYAMRWTVTRLPFSTMQSILPDGLSVVAVLMDPTADHHNLA